MKEPPECKGCIMQTCPRNRWYCLVRYYLIVLEMCDERHKKNRKED